MEPSYPAGYIGSLGALLLHPPYHSNFFTVTIHRRRTVALSSAWIVLFFIAGYTRRPRLRRAAAPRLCLCVTPVSAQPAAPPASRLVAPVFARESYSRSIQHAARPLSALARRPQDQLVITLMAPLNK